MINWFLSLNFVEYIYLSVAIASSALVLTKAIFTAVKFHSIDKLNVEPEDLEQYEEIANNDSDIIKHVPRFMSIMSVNVFLMSFCWAYLFLVRFSEIIWANLFAAIFATFVWVVYALVDTHVKKHFQKNENLSKKD